MALHFPKLHGSPRPLAILSLMLLSLASTLIGCSPASDSTPRTSVAPSLPEHLSLPERNVWYSGFSTVGSMLAEELHHDTEQLHSAIKTFLQHPSEKHRRLAQQYWLRSYEKFQAMEPALHYLKTIAPPNQLQQISLMDQWPIIPGYLDSVPGYPFSGIVNDVTVTLDLKTVIAQHSLTDASEASLGLHVLEFFLWGEASDPLKALQQFSPVEYWQAPQQEQAVSEHPNNRRRKYLLLVSELLRSTCYQANSLWSLPENSRNPFLALESVYATLGAIRKTLHQPALSANEQLTFSGHPHRPLTPRIQTLLHFLSASNPTAPTGANGMLGSPNADHSLKVRTDKIIHKINNIINDSAFGDASKNELDRLDFALTELETILFNAMGSPPHLTPFPTQANRQ